MCTVTSRAGEDHRPTQPSAQPRPQLPIALYIKEITTLITVVFPKERTHINSLLCNDIEYYSFYKYRNN